MRYPFVKLPKKVEMALFLIGEELKGRKFFNELQNIGVSDSPYERHFNAPIAVCLGLDDHADNVFTQIDNILERHSEKIDADDNDSVMRQVFRAYVDLVIERRAQRRNKAKLKGTDYVEPGPVARTGKADFRNLAPFDSIALDTFADIVLIPGDKEELEIISEANPDNYILAFVENRRLFIVTGKVEPELIQATIYITYRTLSGLVVHHSGKVKCDGTIETDRLGVVQNGRGSIELDVETLVVDLTLTKSGSLTVTGSSDETIVLNTGTATIDGANLETTSAKVTIKDSGEVMLAIEDELTARLDGKGCLLYSGSPRLKALSGEGEGTLKQIETSTEDGKETEEEGEVQED
ncbi:MAG: hypothetical protein HOP08_18805 [Cyclobacteriaceae bacterium]|nr:hypothetical protein [Cyclobacteriaceae bacterium]